MVRYYRDEYGIVFRTLEPLNEPYANWWTANGSQEGCHFGPSSQERIIQAVSQQLAAKGLTGTVVSASDENSMDDALRIIGGYSDDTLATIGQVNVHSYAGSRRSDLRALATSLDERLWQSESGPLGQSINDDTEAALFMAGRIIDDLRELEPQAWIDWQSGDPEREPHSASVDEPDLACLVTGASGGKPRRGTAVRKLQRAVGARGNAHCHLVVVATQQLPPLGAQRFARQQRIHSVAAPIHRAHVEVARRREMKDAQNGGAPGGAGTTAGTGGYLIGLGGGSAATGDIIETCPLRYHLEPRPANLLLVVDRLVLRQSSRAQQHSALSPHLRA